MQKEFWNFFREQEATSFGGVPYTYEMLDRLRFYRMKLPSLRTMTQAGGKIIPDLHEKFAAYAEETRLKVMHWFTVDDLMFLKRGGRVSSVSAFAGTLLGIKPVMHVSDEGKLVPRQKLRGRKNAVLELGKHFAAECTDKESTVFIAHADAHDAAEMLKSALLHEHGAKL